MTPINFELIDRFLPRLNAAKSESDYSYFFDLLLLGELVTKTTALYLIANINEDKDRNKYRQEYNLIRADGIGDFALVINNVLTGIPSSFLSSALIDHEIVELNSRITQDSWQNESLMSLVDSLDIFNIAHNKISTRTLFRDWFTLFSSLRNKTKGHGAPTAKKLSEACGYLEKSLSLIMTNLTLFKRPWVYLHRNLSGKYRVSPVNTNNVNIFEYLKREKTVSLENGIYCYTDIARKVNLLYSDPELSNFYFPNGNFKEDSATCEALSYIDDQKQRIDAKSYLVPASKLPASITEGLKELNVVRECFSNVPILSEEYIHRTELEKELTSVLLDDGRYQVVTLKGRGGIGKTSLAINVIHTLNENHPKRFSLIIWFSARDVDLFPSGPKQVQSHVLTQIDIAKEYCRLVYPNQDIKKPIEKFATDLSNNPIGPTLYVLDNFETITNPIEVFEWINTYVRNPNKVLITSRINRNFKADYPIDVTGMTEPQCRDLINKIATKYNITRLLSSSYTDNLITESNGHPYIIKITLGEIARTRKPGKVERIIADKDQILNALFRRTFQTLSPAAKRVFLTLCSWNSVIPVIAIEAILWGNQNEKIDVEGAIEELQKSSFIELVEEQDNVFISVPLAASLYGQTELLVYPEKLAVYMDRSLLMEFGASNSRSIKSGIAPLIEKKFQQVALRLKTRTEFEKERSSLEYIASKYPKAWLFIVDLLKDYGDYDGAKLSMREFLKTITLPTEKEKYWLKYADLCQITSDWNAESMALLELATIPDVSFNIISNSASRINNYFYKNPHDKQMETKHVLFAKLAEIMKQRINKEGDATDFSRLAWLYLNLGDETNAGIYAKRGLEIDQYNVYCQKLKNRLSL